LKCNHYNGQSHRMFHKGAKFPRAQMFYHWLGYISWSATWMIAQESLRPNCAFEVISRLKESTTLTSMLQWLAGQLFESQWSWWSERSYTQGWLISPIPLHKPSWKKLCMLHYPSCMSYQMVLMWYSSWTSHSMDWCWFHCAGTHI